MWYGHLENKFIRNTWHSVFSFKSNLIIYPNDWIAKKNILKGGLEEKQEWKQKKRVNILSLDTWEGLKISSYIFVYCELW